MGIYKKRKSKKTEIRMEIADIFHKEKERKALENVSSVAKNGIKDLKIDPRLIRNFIKDVETKELPTQSHVTQSSTPSRIPQQKIDNRSYYEKWYDLISLELENNH